MEFKDVVEEVYVDLYEKDTSNGKIWTARGEKWMELYHEAHGDMLPDNWRYKMIVDVIQALRDVDDIEGVDTVELLDGLVPVYTNELLEWLASRNDRVGYVDAARECYGTMDTVMSEIMSGYMGELEEVYTLIVDWIQDYVSNYEA